MQKSDILRELIEAGNTFLSGAELCRRHGVSRTAVWKAIQALRAEGYEIESVTNRGYRLKAEPDLLTAARITPLLRHPEIGERLLCFEQISSTNTYAKQLALEDFADGTVIAASEQTAGRGRLGRSFASSPGVGLYFTILWRPGVRAESLVRLTACAGVCVCDAIEQVAGVRPGIKWTNDIVLGNRKLCGILTEMTTEGESGRVQSLIVGIGINVHQSEADFGTELAPIATSVFRETGKHIARAELAAALADRLYEMYDTVLRTGGAEYLNRYRDDLVHIGKPVTVVRGGVRREAIALDIDDEAALIVRYIDTGETAVLNSGEVSVRGLFGYV